jgi:hypothetical protein
MGPARVRAVRVTVDSRPVKSWTEALRALGEGPEHFGVSTLSGRVIAPGERIQAFHAHDTEAGRALYRRVFSCPVAPAERFRD